jgi:hypothetical protein
MEIKPYDEGYRGSGEVRMWKKGKLDPSGSQAPCSDMLFYFVDNFNQLHDYLFVSLLSNF